MSFYDDDFIFDFCLLFLDLSASINDCCSLPWPLPSLLSLKPFVPQVVQSNKWHASVFSCRLCLGSILCVSGILLAPAVFLSLSKLLLFPHHLVSLTGFNSHSLSHSLHLPIHPFCFFYPSLTFNLSPPSHGVLWCVIAARTSYSSL